MNQMQRMLQEAQRMQRKLNEMRAELMKKEFPVDKNGLVKVVLTGNKEVKEIHIDPEALIEDREMIEDSIKAAINEGLRLIEKEEQEIEEQVTGKTGLPF